MPRNSPKGDAAMRAVRHNAIADRAEPYKLRTAPMGVVHITAGVDTQDNRLAVQIVRQSRLTGADAEQLEAAAKAGDALRAAVHRDWMLDEKHARFWLSQWMPD